MKKRLIITILVGILCFGLGTGAGYLYYKITHKEPVTIKESN